MRQLAVTGLGRDAPTVIITNHHDVSIKAPIEHYATVTPDVLQRRFLEAPGQITTSNDTITVARRAYTPVLRQAHLPQDTPVPWWGNRTLRYEFN